MLEGRSNLINIMGESDSELLTIRVFYFVSIIYELFRNPWLKDILVCAMCVYKAPITVQLLGRVLLFSGVKIPQIFMLPDFLECIIRVKHRYMPPLIPGR